MVGRQAPAASVVERIESLGFGGRVGLIGMFDDVECLLGAADVHVAPAADGSAQALVEALAAGAPSVAIDVPLNRWLLGDEAAGLLVPPEDAWYYGFQGRQAFPAGRHYSLVCFHQNGLVFGNPYLDRKHVPFLKIPVAFEGGQVLLIAPQGCLIGLLPRKSGFPCHISAVSIMEFLAQGS